MQGYRDNKTGTDVHLHRNLNGSVLQDDYLGWINNFGMIEIRQFLITWQQSTKFHPYKLLMLS